MQPILYLILIYFGIGVFVWIAQEYLTVKRKESAITTYETLALITMWPLILALINIHKEDGRDKN